MSRPVNRPNYASAIGNAVENGARVELILTDRVINIISEEHHDQLKGLMASSNFKLYRLDEDVKVAFTVTDSVFSLGLFGLTGVYDMASDLICVGDEAIKWGMQLFGVYKNRSKLVKNMKEI